MYEDRDFKTVDCCLNCEHREYAVRKSVFCKVDETFRSSCLVCNQYKKTSNKMIIDGERRILHRLKKDGLIPNWERTQLSVSSTEW